MRDGDGDGAGLIFISHFTRFLPILEGKSVEKYKNDEAGFISHLRRDEKCEMDVM